MTTISSVNSVSVQANTVSSSSTVAVPTVNTVATAATPTPASASTVKVSAAGLTVSKAASATPAPMTVAQALAAGADLPAGTVIKDTAAAVGANFKTLGSLATLSNITSITLSDAKAGTISVARADLTGDLTSSTNTDANLAVLKKITSSYTLNVTGLSASDALTLKSPAKNATLSLSITDTVENITSNLTALQAAAKAKSIATMTLPPLTAGTPKPMLSLTAAQLKASPELMATIKGDFDLTITGVAAADAVTVAGSADKILKASGSGSAQSRVAISDTSANLVKNITALELAATAGRLTSITVSDGKALTLTEAQIKADSHFLAADFSTATNIEATAVAAADVLTVQSLVNANSKLTLTKESVSDTAANIQANLDALEAKVKAGGINPVPTTPATPTISPTPPAPLGPNQVYNPANGHVYEYVAHAGISWETAKAEADAKTYAGAKGYLTTITNQEELDFIENSVLPNHNNDGNIYIGGHLVTGSTSKWQWADGPENGTVFWDNGAVQGQFANWNTSSAYPRTGSGATNEPAVTLNSFFVPQFANSYGTAINSLSAGGNGGYVVEYSGFNQSPAPTPKINPIISSITATDKGKITLTNSTLVSDIDALKVLTGKYTLNVTDISVTDALALKAPSKDAVLALSVKDTAANTAGNWDKLQVLAKGKTLSAITVTDSASSLLAMTSAQLKADADALKLVGGDYKLSVTGVAAADVSKVLTTKNIYSVEVKDTAANILKNLPSIQTAVTAAKIQNVVITDAANPSLSIDNIFALTTTLPNVTLAAGVKFNVKDTASNIIAHARYDIADVIKNAGSIALSDKTPPNLTLADATTLKGLTGLAAGTKYNVADGGALIAAQAALSGEKVLADAASVVVNKNFTITEAKAVSAIKSLAKGSAYSINDTADKILAQSALAGETILSKANAVNVVDTSANIMAKLDQLQVLAKAGKIADIKFTDTPSGALPLTDAQLLNNAEAIGKIVSQRTLPELQPTKPVTPAPLGLTLPPMKTLSVWSAETTLGTIVDGSYQFRPYMRADRWGNMIADLVTPAATYNQAGQNNVSLYLMAQDGLGNTSEPLKIADFNTSLGAPGTPRNGAIYLLKPNIYSASYTPNMVDNQLAVWMEQQPDSTYAMKYRPFSFSPALAAAGSTVSPLTTTGSASTLVSGIDQHITGFNWVTNASSSKFLMEYETLTPGMADKKDIYINTFTVGGTGNNVTATTTNKIASGSNEGARLLTSGLNASAITTVYNNPVDSSIMFIQETTKSDRSGLLISNLDASNGLVANSDRFLDIGPSASGIKINAFEFGGVSTDAAVSTPSVEIIAASTTVPAATSADKPVYKIQFFKGDPALSGSAGTANIIATDSLSLSNPVKAMWNQANIGNNTTMFAFQDGNVVHAVQVGFDGKIMADDQFAIPAGSIFDRYRPLGFINPTAPYLQLYEFIWREPISGSTTGETSIKSRIYDARGTTPLTVNGWNAFNLIAGAAGNDTLVGRGNDVISGGPGNDIINGLLGGKDVVSYLGKSTDYSIISDANDVFKVVVKDLRSGSPDGTDTLTNVLALRFADKTITLLQATPEKTLTQNFLTTSPGITSAASSNARGFIALTGTETGALSVRLVSGNGSVPTNGSALIDAIVNAATPSAFKTAVQAAKTQGSNSVPAFTLEISKTLTTPIDLNVDGTKETGVRVPLDINTESITVGDVSLTPRPLTNVKQQITLSLSQSFFQLSGGPASAWGSSGANGNGINTNSFNFLGSEAGTIKLRIGTNDATQPIPASALKLAANIAAATTPQLFEQALQDYWTASNGQFWVDFSMALTNPVDINGDGKNDTNVNVQLSYYNPGTNASSIMLSSVPQSYSAAVTQSFLKLSPGTTNAWGMIGNNGVSGNYTVTGMEAGTFNVSVASMDGGPLPSDYQVKLSGIKSAVTAGDFASAVTAATNDNMNVSFYYVLNGAIDLVGNGTQATNVAFNVNYPQNVNFSSGLISFTPA